MENKEKPKVSTTRVLLLLLIFIITLFTLIFVYKVAQAEFESRSYKIVIFICILITYSVVIIIPIRGLYNPELKLKAPPAGEKGPRGDRGKSGENGECNSCSDTSMCYKKIMFQITKTYNWWRSLNGLPKYSDNYVIKNEYLKSKVTKHCNSEELKKIMAKFGANNNRKGAYDYMFRMWTIWILIILKYKSGVFFLESESLGESDFLNLLADEHKLEGSDWNSMFTTDAGSDRSKNVRINYDHTVSDTESGVSLKSKLVAEGLNEDFFKNVGVPDNTKSPFNEIKNYKSWYWGSDPYSKPDIIIEQKFDDNELDKQLKLTCSNWTDDQNKIKIKKTNDFFEMFKTDNTANTENGGVYTPFQQFGSKKVTFLRANEFIDDKEHPLFRTYKPLGDVVFESEKVKKYQFEANKCYPSSLDYSEINKTRLTDGLNTILVSGDVKSPTDYDLVYAYKIENGLNREYTNFRIWKPRAPDGYIALGYIVDTTPFGDDENSSKPSTDLIWCLRDEVTEDLNESNTEKNFWKSNQNQGYGPFKSNLVRQPLQKNNILNIFTHVINPYNVDNIPPMKTIKDITDLRQPIPSQLSFVCKKYDKYAEGGETEIYDECSKNTNKDTCESNIKCEYEDDSGPCRYKERNLQDLKKYSISRIYK